MNHPRSFWVRFGLSLGLLFFLLNLTSRVDAAAVTSNTLPAVDFNQRPGWTSSGAWAPDGSLILVDALYSRVLRYSVGGVLLGEVKPTSRFAFPKPTYISAIPGGYLLGSGEGHFVRLDRNLAPVEAMDILAASKGPKHEIGGIYGWVPLGNGEKILTFGDVRDADGTWSSGFLRVTLKDPAKFEIVHPMRFDDPARKFYLVGNPYLASIGNRGFFVLMTSAPSVREVPADSSKSRPLSNLATRKLMGERPQLGEKHGLRSYVSLYASLERAQNFVSGLFAQEDQLYLLKRSGTDWSLTPIDPNSGVAESSRQLGVVANHLTVVPGPKEWAFVEKGAVVGPLQQQVSKVAFVASEVLEAAR